MLVVLASPTVARTERYRRRHTRAEHRRRPTVTRVLMILTGAKTWTMKNGEPHPTGFWAEEFIKPHTAFTEAGFELSVATPGGVTPTVDELSMSKTYYDDATIAAQ